MKAVIISNDPIGRWKSGELGEAEKLSPGNKYDYVITLSPKPNTNQAGLFRNITECQRVFFAYANEIKEL